MWRWKKNEFKIAEAFEGLRRTQKKQQKQGPDVRADDAEIEVKTRKEIPTWLTNPLKKTTLYAQKTGKIPMVIWIENTQSPDEGIALLHAADVQELLRVYRLYASEPPSVPTENPS